VAGSLPRRPDGAAERALGGLLAALPPSGVAVVRRRDAWIVGTCPTEVRVGAGGRAFDVLREIDHGDGFWVGFAAYDLGRSVERVDARAADDVGVADLAFARFDARAVLEPGRAPRIEGSGAGVAALRHALDAPGDVVAPAPLSAWTSSLDRVEFEARVVAVQELLDAGECYQVNLTRRLRCPEPADPRALFAALVAANPSPHAALVDLRETLGLAIVSASPERFLARRGRLVETRPIKGTAECSTDLAGSEKDRAENVMIVDLARNDLGRVCDYGSVEVSELCALERHPGLHHLVSTVRGRLRVGAGLAEVAAATLPPASVTGAPKPRVLQAIEDLEPVRRGVYCGAVGWIDAAGREADLAVAIRTFSVHSGGTDLGVGSGIVADSDPRREWDETCLKARRLLAVAAGRAGAGSGTPALAGSMG
jgi:para-aminobenzoate synthetase component 1